MEEHGKITKTADSSLEPQDDESELIEQARNDPEAFGRLYDRYYSAILNYVYHRTLNIAMAEDLTSNTFFNAMRALGCYQNRGRFSAWLFRIAGNEIRLSRRARQNRCNGYARWRSEVDRLQFGDGGPIALEKAEELAHQFFRIHEALSRLPERYQAVLTLRYFESLSCEEIADVLETKVGTVKSLIHRGLARLKKQYEDVGATYTPVLHYLVRKE